MVSLFFLNDIWFFFDYFILYMDVVFIKGYVVILGLIWFVFEWLELFK